MIHNGITVLKRNGVPAMHKVTVDTFMWITSLEPDRAALNYYAMYWQDTHAALFEGFQKGYDAGFDQAVNTLHSDKDVSCQDCGSTNTVAYLTVHSVN